MNHLFKPSDQYFVTEKGSLTKTYFHSSNDGDDGQYYVQKQTDAFGNQVDYQYAANQVLGSISSGTTAAPSSDGRSVGFNYRNDATSFGMSSIVLNYPAASGGTRTWTPTIDASNGRLTSFSYPSSAGSTPKISFTYTSGGNIQTITDQLNRVWTYSYDGQGRVTKVVSPSQSNPVIEIKYENASPGGKTWVVRYQTHAGYPLSDANFKSLATQYDYYGVSPYVGKVYCPLKTIRQPNVSNVLATTSDDTDATETYTFHQNTGLLLDKTDARGTRTDYNWDYDKRNLTDMTVTDGLDPSGVTRKYLTHYEYTANGLPASATTKVIVGSASAVVTGSTRNAYGDSTGTLLTESTVYNDAGGSVPAVTTYSRYDPNNTGRLVATHAGSDPETVFSDFSPYTDAPQATTRPSGGQSFVYYDALGRKTSENSPDANGNARTTSYTYDVWDRLTATRYPDNSAATTSYRVDGSVSRRTDRRNASTSFSYDGGGTVLSKHRRRHGGGA